MLLEPSRLFHNNSSLGMIPGHEVLCPEWCFLFYFKALYENLCNGEGLESSGSKSDTMRIG